MSEDEWDDDMSEALDGEFEAGDVVFVCTRVPNGRGESWQIDIGLLSGFVPDGVLLRRTHKRVVLRDEDGEMMFDSDGDPEWDYVELQRTILTFINWRVIDRIESQTDVTQELELSDFAALMDRAKPEDIANAGQGDGGSDGAEKR